MNATTTNTLTSDHWETRLLEAFDALWDDFVDPREAYADSIDGWWLPVGAASGGSPRTGDGPFSEQMLGDLRAQSRRLAATNEFAINGLENRISYIVGPGHSYRATICKGMDASCDIAIQVQRVIERFTEENRWQHRQQEIWPIAINLQHWPGQVHNIMGQGARHERRRLFDV
ncbi:MAG: hypothetical protein L0228_18780, partial [Planctomycetes bacterium]|nr:hypothetical protein [Planctomycetota bacterium]